MPTWKSLPIPDKFAIVSFVNNLLFQDKSACTHGALKLFPLPFANFAHEGFMVVEVLCNKGRLAISPGFDETVQICVSSVQINPFLVYIPDF
jgi:hypothetical protein